MGISHENKHLWTHTVSNENAYKMDRGRRLCSRLSHTLISLLVGYPNCIQPKTMMRVNMGRHLLGPIELAGDLLQD
jgi:hypothetical protein